MVDKVVKKQLGKKNFYLLVLSELKISTNLSNIQEKLNISKQQLNYYLRQLRDKGLVTKKGKGWWEVVKSSKNSTKYGKILPKDFIRGHGYILNVNLTKEIPNWKNRIHILKKKGHNYILVGALKTTPRIKVLGRKVWLCNNHIRIFEKKDKSFYGENAIISRAKTFEEIYDIIRCLENKLGISLRPYDFSFQKEHYAFIKNDLAIDQNKKGIIWRISDEDGEWLLIDDSLGEGGELENTGKKALPTNIKMQKWWNEQKETKFDVTPKFILNSINQVTQNQKMFNNNFESHVTAIRTLSSSVLEMRDEITRLNNIILSLKN